MSAKTSDELGGQYTYSSHSFNQLTAINGDHLVTADHGDAYPRAMQLGITKDFPSSRSTRSAEVFTLPGRTGDNYTGATLTGLQLGSGRALTTGNSVPNGHPINGVNGSSTSLHRNVYLTSTDLSTLSTTFKWITTLPPSKGATWAEQPRMVKVSDTRFVLLFNVTDGKTDTLNYRLIDQNGNVLASKSWKGVPYNSNSQPILVGSQLYWASFVGASNGWPKLNYLYQMDLTNLSAPSLVEQN